jgi:hypothetical protein
MKGAADWAACRLPPEQAAIAANHILGCAEVHTTSRRTAMAQKPKPCVHLSCQRQPPPESLPPAA